MNNYNAFAGLAAQRRAISESAGYSGFGGHLYPRGRTLLETQAAAAKTRREEEVAPTRTRREEEELLSPGKDDEEDTTATPAGVILNHGCTVSHHHYPAVAEGRVRRLRGF
jgi:hypothetical protein